MSDFERNTEDLHKSLWKVHRVGHLHKDGWDAILALFSEFDLDVSLKAAIDGNYKTDKKLNNNEFKRKY